MALNITGILDAVVSHAMASGHFERVNQFEPDNPPGHGLTCGVWADRITALRTSGLNSVSTLVVFNVRVYGSMQADPPDAIDPNMVAAADALGEAYTGGFTLGGLVRQVDLLGAHGSPFDVRAGYLSIDGTRYRVLTISLPVVVNDLWTEAP
jgi:hypothetical protein